MRTSEISDSIKFKKQNETEKFLSDVKSTSLEKENVIRIASRIWNSEDIANEVMIFLRAVKSWKTQALAREGANREEMEEAIKTIEFFLKSVQGTLEEDIDHICEATGQIVIEELLQAYAVWKSRKKWYAKQKMNDKIEDYGER